MTIKISYKGKRDQYKPSIETLGHQLTKLLFRRTSVPSGDTLCQTQSRILCTVYVQNTNKKSSDEEATDT